MHTFGGDIVAARIRPTYPRGTGQGRGGGRLGIGPPQYCVCPVDGEKFPKTPGVPCQQLTCPKHKNVRLIGSDT
ncbi:MAG: hypothetical protein JRI56_13000 [Deltaproteobacteria bacterium]|nr:hypothetical protein [Deltaproteobacteria bacterium]